MATLFSCFQLNKIGRGSQRLQVACVVSTEIFLSSFRSSFDKGILHLLLMRGNFIWCAFLGWLCLFGLNIIVLFALEGFLSLVTGRLCLACETPVMQQLTHCCRPSTICSAAHDNNCIFQHFFIFICHMLQAQLKYIIWCNMEEKDIGSL